MKLLLPVLVSVLVATGSAGPSIGAVQIDYAWDMMCNGQVKPISKKLKLTGRQKPVELKDSIQPCTKHVYEFSRKRSRQLVSRFKEGTDIWMMLSHKGQNGHSPPTTNLDEKLSVDSNYFLTIVTTKATTYILELKFQ